jgi:hypothetical protein
MEPQEPVLPRMEADRDDLNLLMEDSIGAPLDLQEADDRFLTIDEGGDGDDGNIDSMQLVTSSELQFSDHYPSIMSLDGLPFVPRTGDSTLQSESSAHQVPSLSDTGSDLFFNTCFPLSPGLVSKGLESRAEPLSDTNSTQRAFQQSPWYSKGGQESKRTNFSAV